MDFCVDGDGVFGNNVTAYKTTEHLDKIVVRAAVAGKYMIGGQNIAIDVTVWCPKGFLSTDKTGERWAGACVRAWRSGCLQRGRIPGAGCSWFTGCLSPQAVGVCTYCRCMRVWRAGAVRHGPISTSVSATTHGGVPYVCNVVQSA